ncbi:MAG: DUF499 domain-containing protein [Syntrophobacterales bacterium]|nr:DUF499 domain-containing protein [Syntrophobacterales bacterium]
MEGKYLQAELALDLYTIAEGTAKPPYDKAESFFRSTHPTATLKQVLMDTLEYLAGVKVVNPILLLDAGFGGGKTHTMAAIYYAAKNPTIPEIREITGKILTPINCRIVVIDGSAYGGRGVRRGERFYRTIWADFLHQLGETKLAEDSDAPDRLPDRQTITQLLKKGPTLILIDELPKYLDLVKDQPDLLNKVKHFIHTLSLSVCEAERCMLILSVAGDVYIDAADAVRRELTEAMKILNRKMQSIEPVKSEDVPQILKKRLFDFINSKMAETTAKAYIQLYEQINAPDRYRTAEYQNRIVSSYPFHPELIDVLYERLSTLPEFQRTRGALRLLAHVIQKIWKDHEEDAFLIHPHHVDLSVSEIVEELTTRIKEEKYRNAIYSDVYSQGGKKAKAQEKDEDYSVHFKAPLFRRVCNTIYLYSLTGAKEEARGIDLEDLIATLAVPTKEDHVQYYRDRVIPTISDTFWYIEPVGNRYVFRREPTENRIIDQESQNIPTSRIVSTVKGIIQEIFTAKGKGHFFIEIFPEDPSKVDDDTNLKVAILNPILGYTITTEGEVSDRIAQFILNRDSRGNLRTYRNNTFLLVSREGAWESLRDTVARLEVAKALAEDPERYGIPHDKKKSLQQKVAQYETAATEAIRASFTYIVYTTRGGRVEAKSFRPSGYGTAQPGQEILWQILSKILNRVTEEALDPEYVKTEVWSIQTPETTTRALFEGIHKKSGVVLPENQALFEKTVLEGVKRGTWVLIQQGEVYAPEKPPNRVIISSDSVLLLPEEAGRRGITDPRGHVCSKCLKWPCQCIKPPLPPQPPQPPQPTTGIIKEIFEPAPPKIQFEDLDRWIKREGVNEITEAKVRVIGTTDVALQFKNLVRLARAGRKVQTSVQIKSRTYQTNMILDVSFSADDVGLDAPAAKILEDIARWSLPDFEGIIQLKAEGLPINELRQLLKNTIGADNPDIKLGLEISHKRER